MTNPPIKIETIGDLIQLAEWRSELAKFKSQKLIYDEFADNLFTLNNGLKGIYERILNNLEMWHDVVQSTTGKSDPDVSSLIEWLKRSIESMR